MKRLVTVAAVLSLTGCIPLDPATLDRDGLANGARGGTGSGIAAAVRQYDTDHPGIRKICLPLDSGFKYSTGEFAVSKRSYNSEDVVARWDHLARLGLFAKRESREAVIYKITPLGRSAYNDGKCSPKVERYGGDYQGPALLYGILEFDRITKVEASEGAMWSVVAFTKQFARIEPWSRDKDFRRSWQLQGIDEIERLRWFTSYRITSNGLEIRPPELFILQN